MTFCINYFCEEKLLKHYLEYWKAKRMAWWNQYMHTPSNIDYKHMSKYKSSSEAPDGNSDSRLGYYIAYKEKQANTEKIVENIEHKGKYVLKLKNKSQMVHAIQITNYLDTCLNVFLDDAFLEKNSNKYLNSHPDQIEKGTFYTTCYTICNKK
ncbi:uncharacterized protein LOC135932004 [Gordionus sp. m RMFG-2023]|uniref:uncharacterized protein LOC135932004 n=1 Tax=Gordionus sp. m RMFG-2023 TaxID=3053472 RepID=UPI0031FBBDCC